MNVPLDATHVSKADERESIPGYRLISLLGRGGMGEVYQAEQLSLNRPVAIKLLYPHLVQDETLVDRFNKEGIALAALRHPNIVSVIDRGHTSETYYIVMELIEGPSLRERMRSPNLTTAQALDMWHQVACGIEYAHEQGIVHRDLKPENVLFDEPAGDVVKVTDFGLAGIAPSESRPNLNMTQVNVAMGTASYMSPEQHSDAAHADRRADVYALGVLLYELLVGELPVGRFEMPSVLKEHVDSRFDAIVVRCLRPNPEDRFQSVTELLEETTPLMERRSTDVQSGKRDAWRSKFPVRLTIVFATMLSILVATIGWVRFSAGEEGTEKNIHAASGLTANFPGRWPLSMAGTVDVVQSAVSVGEGPDAVTALSAGVKAEVLPGQLILHTTSEDPVSRLVFEREVQLEDGFSVAVELEARPLNYTFWESTKMFFGSTEREPQVALMLWGAESRYVTLLLPMKKSVATLEWSLGSEKTGTLAAPFPAKFLPWKVGFHVDPVDGKFTVHFGSDTEIWAVPLPWGSQWKELFGGVTRVALGCMHATCHFKQISWKGLHPTPSPTK